MTGSGVMIGTPEYMSPEQAELKDVDKRADIYSLGIVLYEMVSGRVPFDGETPLSIAMKHKTEKPRNVREWEYPGLGGVGGGDLEMHGKGARGSLPKCGRSDGRSEQG
jgi:serine/threonine protein kinase